MRNKRLVIAAAGRSVADLQFGAIHRREIPDEPSGFGQTDDVRSSHLKRFPGDAIADHVHLKHHHDILVPILEVLSVPCGSEQAL